MKLVAVVIALSACTSDPDVVRYNTGTACLYASRTTIAPESQSFTPEASVIVSVTTGTGPCEGERRTECSIERDGSTLHITSVASWFHAPDDGRVCTRELVPLTATCATDSLAAGEYTVTFGAKSVVLVVPATVERPCMWNAGSAESSARDG